MAKKKGSSKKKGETLKAQTPMPEVLSAGLQAAKNDLQKQVGTGPYNITQAQADAEFNRLKAGVSDGSINLDEYGRPTSVNTPSGTLTQQMINSMMGAFKNLGDSMDEPGLANALAGGLNIGNIFAQQADKMKIAENSPELERITAEAQRLYDQGLGTDPNVQAALDALRGQLGTAGQMTPDMIAALAKAKALTDGYSQPQLNALRGQILRQTGADTTGALNQLQSRLGARGVEGGVGSKLAAQIALAGVRTRGDLNSKLLADQYDRMVNATNAYGTMAGNYNTQLTNNLAGVAERLGNLGATNQQNQANYRLNTFNNLMGATNNQVGFTQNAQRANQANSMNALTIASTTPFSMASLYEAKAGRESGERIAKEQLKAAQAFRGGGGGGGGGGGSSAPEERTFQTN